MLRCLMRDQVSTTHCDVDLLARLEGEPCACTRRVAAA
jgi:hypothetical protein